MNTRLSKLDNGEYHAIILAAAGLIRLGFHERIASFLDSTESLPAGGQGAVGIECRTQDDDIHRLLAPLHHRLTAEQVLAERAVNRRLEGGCQVPIGCFAVHEGDQLWLRGPGGGTRWQRHYSQRTPRPRQRCRSPRHRAGGRPVTARRPAHFAGGIRQWALAPWRIWATRPAAHNPAWIEQLQHLGFEGL